jgi:spore coat protein U-like protein
MNNTPGKLLLPLLWRKKILLRTVLFLSMLMLTIWSTAALAFQCNVTATGLSFGGYDALSPIATSATADIGVTCNLKSTNKNAPLTVTVSVNAGNSGSFSQRVMASVSGGYVLNYNLYMDAAGSIIWGDGSGGSNNQVVNVTKESPFNAKIYGKISPGQNVPAGSYSDAITVTVLW